MLCVVTYILEIKLKILKHYVNSGICKYLLSPQKHMTDLQILDKPHSLDLKTQLSSVIVSTTEPVASIFTAFRSSEETAEFIKCAM
jgi:hypothetical protein